MCFWKAVSKHFLNDININPKPLIILSRLSTTFYNVFTIHNKTPFHSTNPQQKSYFKPALPQRAARLLWNSFFFDYFSKTCKIVRFGSYLFHTCPHFAYLLSFLFYKIHDFKKVQLPFSVYHFSVSLSRRESNFIILHK